MRLATLTLLPMVLSAIISLIVGERLAQYEVVEEIPVDQNRLLRFWAQFETEVERLDSLYLGHLHQLAKDYSNKDADVRESAEELVALKEMYFLKEGRDPKQLNLHGISKGMDVRVRLEGSNAAVMGSNPVVTLTKEKVEETPLDKGVIHNVQDNGPFVYWARFDKDSVVALVVDSDALNSFNEMYMRNWLKNHLSPLREVSAHFSITPPKGEPIILGDRKTRGSAALITPKQVLSGRWYIQAWDGTKKIQKYDTLKLCSAWALAFVLIFIGFVAFFHQRQSQKLARQRVSFVNQVSHELGSPLTNMSLSLDLAIDQLESNKDASRRRLKIVAEEIDRLHRLVSNVLTFSRYERGELNLHFEMADVDQLVHQVLQSWSPALERKGIQVVFEPGINKLVRIDSDAVTQIISNLISNAEKYAYSGKWLKITTEYSGRTATVLVEDRGPGIPKQERMRIFRPFERLNNGVDEGPSGAGLGLSIAQELARQMQGSLSILDSPVGCLIKLSILCLKSEDKP